MGVVVTGVPVRDAPRETEGTVVRVVDDAGWSAERDPAEGAIVETAPRLSTGFPGPAEAAGTPGRNWEPASGRAATPDALGRPARDWVIPAGRTSARRVAGRPGAASTRAGR